MDFGSIIISLLLVSLVRPIYSFKTSSHQLENQTFQVEEEFHKLRKSLKIRLQQINKPSIKIIQSPDGDIIDCVMSHKQPAFDHLLLKGKKPLGHPNRPKEYNQMANLSDNLQLWKLSGESCPEESIPIRRTKEQDILRANSISLFGRKLNHVTSDDTNNAHEYSIGYVTGDYKGAKASMSVWAPNVESQVEFSVAQIWIMSDSSADDLNTVEAGWQVSPHLYGDNRPRLFIYWTADRYKKTGCYNLLCPGFVQTSKNIVVGGAISPISTYNGGNFDITLSIRKDLVSGNWWFLFGSEQVGYWPSSLFPKLKDNAHQIEFGGEIVNSKSKGSHTSTQMGSGHFAEEGYGKAAYFRNLEVVKSDNILSPLSEDPKYLADNPNCYNIIIKGGSNNEWGKYFYYGGPGRNAKCP